MHVQSVQIRMVHEALQYLISLALYPVLLQQRLELLRAAPIFPQYGSDFLTRNFWHSGFLFLDLLLLLWRIFAFLKLRILLRTKRHEIIFSTGCPHTTFCTPPDFLEVSGPGHEPRVGLSLRIL